MKAAKQNAAPRIGTAPAKYEIRSSEIDNAASFVQSPPGTYRARHVTSATRHGRIRLVWRILLMGLVCLLSSAILAVAFYAPELPAPTGKSPVGRKSFAWTDASRAEPWIDNAAGKRELLLHVWYPANPSARPETSAYYPGLPQLGDQFKWYERFVLGSVRSRILAKAEFAPPQSPAPVLLFSTGAGNATEFYTSILEDLASHGFVVIAMEHTHEGQGQVFPDGRIARPESRRQEPVAGSPTFSSDFGQFYRRRIDVRARDAIFVLDELTRPGKDDSMLGGRIDSSRVGILGHSIGGVAACEAARRDRRFRAVANLDGLVASLPMYMEPAGSAMNAPLLFLGKPLLGEEARTKQTAAFQSMEGGSYRVLLDGARHDTFSDTPLLTPGDQENKTRMLAAVRAYLLAFFSKELLNQESALLDAPTEANIGVSVERFQHK